MGLHFNRIVKTNLKNIRSNVTEKSVKVAAESVGLLIIFAIFLKE